jgi:ubiquitin-protein ligase
MSLDNKLPIQIITAKSGSSPNRLAKDIRDVLRNPLEDSGIYYKHHESDMLTGYAMIIGPDNTPYRGGFYLFEIKYPTDYPYSPPHVIFSTKDGSTRFHPNFYANGKVCLSILNTWFGESWSSCDTIRTVLLQICIAFTPIPLLNEPGIHKSSIECSLYTEAIEYHNLDAAVCNIVSKTGHYLPFFDLFYDTIREVFSNLKESHIAFIKSKAGHRSRIHIPIYEMTSVIDYPSLLLKIENI